MVFRGFGSGLTQSTTSLSICSYSSPTLLWSRPPRGYLWESKVVCGGSTVPLCRRAILDRVSYFLIVNRDDDEVGPYYSQNRNESVSKQRRGRKHCPVCLAPLVKNARRTRLVKNCVSCQAHISLTKRCIKCSASAIWENIKPSSLSVVRFVRQKARGHRNKAVSKTD